MALTQEAIDRLQAQIENGLDESFHNAPTETGSIYDLPPDGLYQCILDEFDFFEGGGQAFMKMRWKLEYDEHGNDTEYGGKVLDTGPYALEDTERFRFLKGDLARLGINPDEVSLRDLLPGSTLLATILDARAMLTVQTDKKGRINEKTGTVYRNVYLRERLADGEAGGGFTPRSDVPIDGMQDFVPPPAQGATDDDIPFLRNGPPEFEEAKTHATRPL